MSRGEPRVPRRLFFCADICSISGRGQCCAGGFHSIDSRLQSHEPMADRSPVDVPGFLDVDELLDRATVAHRPQIPKIFLFVGGIALVLMAAAYLAPTGANAVRLIEILFPLLALGLVAATLFSSTLAIRRHRNEVRQLEAVEEFIQLRNWTGAGMAIEGLFVGPEPARNPLIRSQGLIFLSVVLARYGRFTDAITVQNYLLENIPFDPGTEYALRIGRVMAMLREDHLFDADRAINELRRLADRSGQNPDATAGLTLVEMYRDVKTGHPAEAIDLFESKLATMRDRLGHRVADAYGLVSRAYDLLDRATDARLAWARATQLAPAMELVRRYPELNACATKYETAGAPKGM